MHYARAGTITEEMAFVAAREGLDPEFIRSEVQNMAVSHRWLRGAADLRHVNSCRCTQYACICRLREVGRSSLPTRITLSWSRPS